MNSSARPKVFVDIHEPSVLAEALGAEHVALGDNRGDILIVFDEKDYRIEIKRNEDFSHSLKQGRLHNQIAGIRDCSDWSALILEDFMPLVDCDRWRSTVDKVNISIPVLRTNDMADTVCMVEKILEYVVSGSLLYLRRRLVVVDAPCPEIGFLAGLPNVGVTRARKLLRRYGSPMVALECLDDWGSVDSWLNENRRVLIRDILYKQNRWRKTERWKNE